jgi:hemerythrin superfamily protein
MSETILNTLRQEHREIEDLIYLIGRVDNYSQRKGYYQAMIEILLPHMAGEENSLYSRLKDEIADKDAIELAKMAIQEHAEIKNLIKELEKIEFASNEWQKVFNLFKQVFLKHVEEEESEIFNELKEDFSKDELIDISEEFQEAKYQIEI